MDDAHRLIGNQLHKVLSDYYAGNLTVDATADQVFALIQQLKSSGKPPASSEVADRLARLATAPMDSLPADVVLGTQPLSADRAKAAEALNDALQRRANH
jgi:hypothetical protein